MPAQPQWLLRLPAIISELEQFDAPVVDRACFEKIFGVGRRRAIELMHHFSGHQVGRTFLIDRQLLVSRLRAGVFSGNFELEQTRRLRVSDELVRLRKLAPGRNVRITAKPESCDHRLADLPAGIHLSHGQLRIEFAGTAELLRHLFDLSQAILNDYATFEGICGTGEGDTRKA